MINTLVVSNKTRALTKIKLLTIGLLFFTVSFHSHAVPIFYTDSASFNAASTTTLVEDFESFPTKNTALSSFTSNGITYTGHAGTPFDNIWVSSPGYTNYGVPLTTSSILTANGDEDFTLDFGTLGNALGFDTYLNAYGPATLQVFGASGILGTYTHNHDPSTVGFLGITADEDITSIRWTTVNGRVINTGIDNILLGNVITPVPSPTPIPPTTTPTPSATVPIPSTVFLIFGWINRNNFI